MRFPKQLLSLFQLISHPFDSLPRAVGDNESTTRFIFVSGFFNKKGRIKPQVFTPPKSAGDISIYRTQNCSDKKIWYLGNKFVGAKRKQPVIARADLLAKMFTNVNLKIESNFRPHPRHAVVSGWPPPETHELLMKAQELANNATLVVNMPQ